MREELGTLQALVLSFVLLNVLRLSIRTVGPFALPRATRQAGQLVDSMSKGAALVLGRIPGRWMGGNRAQLGQECGLTGCLDASALASGFLEVGQVLTAV